ncbi:adenylate/guanylate cyclase domain-containing protein [Mycolicibacterium madagascariense]|uniref:Adenylate/guanylate cyclase domain-containing protein n=2 Tax=Mycolicibacterium madagascariense TaxID=212765 RepID=A0A7I7XEE4_9MYCO|nr:adenylate/guanylate cyclase domain-containing protein [Mycolicibacterium madagascariense]
MKTVDIPLVRLRCVAMTMVSHDPPGSVSDSMLREPPAQPEPPTRRRRLRVSIQSKLLVMLLATSVLSSAVVGVIGYESGRSSLRASVFDRLTEIRQSQTRQLEGGISDLENSLVVYSRGTTATEAVEAFTVGFDDLSSATISPAQQQALDDYYTKRFAKDKKEQTGEDFDVTGLVPTTPAARYLQAHYTAPFGYLDQPEVDWDAVIANDDAHDGSSWSAANAAYNGFFRELVTRFKYEDALLLDTRGNVIYTAYKGVDLGTNILTGPYKGSDLNGAFQRAIDAGSKDYVGVTDFGEYRPSTEPTAWFVAPVGPPGQVKGVMALQFPVSKINEMMTMGGHWKDAGMGDTGETIIVGPDDLMRSNTRLFIENPEEYRREVVEAGTPPDIADDAIRQHGTTLVQPVATQSAKYAEQGQQGTLIADDYLGNESLQAYAPVHIPGLRWGVVAKIDTSEAFAPVTAFTKQLVVSTVLIILAVSVAALLLARLFVRPIRRLEAGAEQVSTGVYGTTIPVETRDEFGDLTVAFNEMSRNLAIKEDLLEEHRREIDRMMASMMPETVMTRYRDGEETIASDHQDVTVIFAQVAGLDDVSADLTSEESLLIVNKLVHQFDLAAQRLGIERVRSLRNGYLATCGLNVPRIDQVRRTVDFALEMHRIVVRFNGTDGTSLELKAAIHSGTVSSGLVGRASPVYDIWGETVDLVYRVQAETPDAGVFVTSTVHDAMDDSASFTEADPITVAGHPQPTWRLAVSS